MERVDVSICIATCERPQGLARLFGSLVRLKVPVDLRCEILVVDNDAAQSAAAVIQRYAGVLPIRALFEPERNIARARNRALAEARGDWLAFIDDDESACEDWLVAYWDCAAEAEADGWFGPVLAEREGAGRAAAAAPCARATHATGTRLGLADLRTGNAFVRRRSLGERRFDPAFGRSGGSDSELFGSLLREGADFRWCAEASVTELVPRERQRWGYVARRAFRGGVVATRLARRWEPGVRADLARALRAVAGLALCLGDAALCWLPARARAARALLRACTQAGHLHALCGGNFEEYRDRA
jgi:glycosyltransferase involved in cell wall biosynthesis